MLAVIVGSNELQGRLEPFVEEGRSGRLRSDAWSRNDVGERRRGRCNRALCHQAADLGRKRLPRMALCHRDVDVLISGIETQANSAPCCGAWAFGWRPVFPRGPPCGLVYGGRGNGSRRTDGRNARRSACGCALAGNGPRQYDRILFCNGRSPGTSVSRFSLPVRKGPARAYGDAKSFSGRPRKLPFASITPCPRHDCRFRSTGSILLSVISQLLQRQRRG